MNNYQFGDILVNPVWPKEGFIVTEFVTEQINPFMKKEYYRGASCRINRIGDGTIDIELTEPSTCLESIAHQWNYGGNAFDSTKFDEVIIKQPGEK